MAAYNKAKHLNILKGMGFTGTYDQLKRLEYYAHALTVQDCNGDISYKEMQRREKHIEKRIKHLFGGTIPDGMFLNHDPRGYALKIERQKTPAGLHKDFGGYGVLVPENI